METVCAIEIKVHTNVHATANFATRSVVNGIVLSACKNAVLVVIYVSKIWFCL
jgi:hypothetical protein